LPDTASELFAWLREQTQDRLLSLCAYCTAITVNGVTDNEEGHGLDALIEATRLDMTQWWTPTAAGYRKRHTEYSNAGNGKEKGLMDAISGMGIG
jgi:ParB family chromosome partitioning protein